MTDSAERPRDRVVLSLREQPAFDRKVVCHHYEQMLRSGEPAFSVATIEKKSFGHSSVMVVLLSSVSRRHQVLYSARRAPEGYRFRRLHPESEGSSLSKAFDEAQSDDFQSLAELGLSYDEIGALTGRSRSDLRKVFRKVW